MNNLILVLIYAVSAVTSANYNIPRRYGDETPEDLVIDQLANRQQPSNSFNPLEWPDPDLMDPGTSSSFNIHPAFSHHSPPSGANSQFAYTPDDPKFYYIPRDFAYKGALEEVGWERGQGDEEEEEEEGEDPKQPVTSLPRPYVLEPSTASAQQHPPSIAAVPQSKWMKGQSERVPDWADSPPVITPVPSQQWTGLPWYSVVQKHVQGADGVQRADSADDIYFTAIVAGCSAAAVVGVVAAGVYWYKLQRRAKAAAEADYPAYGVTGPRKDLSPPGDRKLAQSAQMYHYQHQKQQMIALESNNTAQKEQTVSGGQHSEEQTAAPSDGESEEENEEGDYTVYECPGLAPQTGEMEVKNPLFHDEPAPASRPITSMGFGPPTPRK